MKRNLLLGIAMAASVALSAGSVHGKPFVIHRWHGYGFLPGYHQPPNTSVPVYATKGSRYGTPDDAPRYWTGASWYYFGRPAFVHGRWNGGGFGSCWTYTPIGFMWNCG